MSAGIFGKLLRAVASESYVVLVGCALAAVLMLIIGASVKVDTWFVLAAGGVVSGSGPPGTDGLAAWTLGRDWIDQQWLGQLVLHSIWRAGGFALLGLVHGLIAASTFVAALVAARRRGGSPRDVARVGLLATVPFFLVAGSIRTQTLALPLFLVVLWLLVADSRARSARVFFCLPILVVWANVHGSVLLGCGLMALAAAVSVPGDLRGRDIRGVTRSVAMAAGAALAILVTPYGVSVLSYFDAIVGNAEIARTASDWMPTSLEPVQVPFFLLGALTFALIGGARGLLTTFERLTLVALFAMALAAQRNLGFFALAATVLLPSLLTSGWPVRAGRAPAVILAATVSAGAVLGVCYAALRGAQHAEDTVEEHYPSQAAAVVAREAAMDPSLRIFADLPYADWLLVRHPELAGRIPFDIRYELLTPAELRRVRRVRDQVGVGWRGAIGTSRLLVLDRSHRPLGALPSTASIIAREAGARTLFSNRDVAVILRRRPQGGRK